MTHPPITFCSTSESFPLRPGFNLAHMFALLFVFPSARHLFSVCTDGANGSAATLFMVHFFLPVFVSLSYNKARKKARCSGVKCFHFSRSALLFHFWPESFAHCVLLLCSINSTPKKKKCHLIHKLQVMWNSRNKRKGFGRVCYCWWCDGTYFTIRQWQNCWQRQTYGWFDLCSCCLARSC